ncbi:hypothetical protein [Pollutibacter soli]|uniref:hypothetical protein n=1 Tax=Pollutibacter soli TaxID=3034157 RepID=UPI00301384B2
MAAGRGLAVFVMLGFFSGQLQAQELYVFTEPASNMPAKSASLKYKGKFLEGYHSQKLEQRHSIDAEFGLSNKLMFHVGSTFSDMYSYPEFQWESVNAYLKYRFLSKDEIHKHFRAAVFMEGSYSRNDMFYDEISFDGDQSGIRTGVIATQLLHKLALSTTLSVSQVLNEQRWDKTTPDPYSYQSFNYSLSAGYLIFPFKYTSFKQTNFNLYLELLGSQALDKKLYYVDLAPAMQFIFNSTIKLNFGYRFQLDGNMHRMAKQSYMVSLETVFLNLLKKRS